VGRFGEPEQIVAIATFLASPLASFITGTTTAEVGWYQMFAF
jgi:3-oxoacyl-[acyl-carrier protein] reductase